MYFKFYTNNFISLHILVNPVIFVYVNCGMVLAVSISLLLLVFTGQNMLAVILQLLCTSVTFCDSLIGHVLYMVQVHQCKNKHSLFKVNSI